MTVAVVRADDIVPVAWKNGGGLTRDLLCEPAGHDWRIRVSLADIDRDGPFSAFPGVERWFAVVQGAGVRLAFAAGEQRVGPYDAAVRFDGAEAPGCTLVEGRTRDLNLMLRGGAHGVMRRGVMRRGGEGDVWADEPGAQWPLRGCFDVQTMTLHWGLAAGPLQASGPVLWMGVAP